jgi:hypothetical protein
MQTEYLHDQFLGDEAGTFTKQQLFDALADNHEKLGQVAMRNSAEAYQNGRYDGYQQAIEDQGWKRYLHFVFGFISACVVVGVVLLVRAALT